MGTELFPCAIPTQEFTELCQYRKEGDTATSILETWKIQDNYIRSDFETVTFFFIHEGVYTGRCRLVLFWGEYQIISQVLKNCTVIKKIEPQVKLESISAKIAFKTQDGKILQT